jgi:hypothetical protein
LLTGTAEERSLVIGHFPFLIFHLNFADIDINRGNDDGGLKWKMRNEK